MAEEIGVKLSLDAGESSQTLESLKKKLADMYTTLDNIKLKFGENSREAKTFESELDKVEKTTTRLENSTLSLVQQYKLARNETQRLTEQFGALSPEALKAAQAAAKLKDAIGDSNQLISALNPDAKFQAFTSTIQGIAGGFSALTGIMALLGDESKETQQNILKVQAALAVTQGINSITSLKDTFINLAAVVKGSVISTFTTLKGLLNTLGIGSIIGLIGTLIYAWKNSQKTVDDLLTPALKRAREETAKLTEEMKKNVDAVSLDERIMRALGATDTQVSNIRIGNIYKYIDALNKQIEAEKEAQRQQAKLLSYDVNNVGQFADIFGNNRQKNQDIINATGSKIKELDNLRKGAIISITEENKKLLDGINKSLEETNKKQVQADKTSESESKRFAAEAAKIRQEGIDKEKEIIFELTKVGKDARTQELLDLKNSYEEKKKILTGAGVSLGNLNKLYQAQQLEVNDKYNKEAEQQALASMHKQFKDLSDSLEAKQTAYDKDFKKQVEAANKTYNYLNQLKPQTLQAEKDILEQKELLNQQFYERSLFNEQQYNQNLELNAESRKQIAMGEIEVRKQTLGNYSSILGSVSEIIGRQTAAGKAFAVAAATIDTYASIAATLKAASTTYGFIPGFAIAQAIATGAFGFAQVAAILRTKVPGQGGSGGTAPTPLSATATVSNTQLNPDQLGQIGNATSRAFILSTDIQRDQTRIQQLNRAARLY